MRASSIGGKAFMAALAASTAWAGAAWAQNAPPAAEPTAGEIVVTANRRQERITDVPFAITAIGAREIADRGAFDLTDLQYSIPGLNIQQLTPGAEKITLRGITPGSGTGLPVVGVYVDEVGISIDQQQRDGAFPLTDLARVEVLRGPQGTLYGQGSVAGTIRYITKDPSFTKFGGYAEGNMYLQEQGGVGYRFNGAIGVPIATDKAGLRIAGGYDRLAGWIDYPNAANSSGGKGVNDANVTKRYYIRPKLVIQPTDALHISLLYEYYKQDTETDGISGFDGTSTRALPVLLPGSDKFHLGNGIISYNLGPATLLASSGYQWRELVFRGAFGPFIGAFDTTYKQFSQEVRLTSNGEGPFHYTIGGWYRNFTSAINRTFFLNGAPTPVARRVGTDPVNSDSWAAFGDATYSVTSRFDLSAGLRYYDDHRQIASTIPAVVTTKAAFNSYSPRVNLRYKWNDDASSYITASKGFRSGGFNPIGPAYGPESLWNYEFGTKASLLDKRLFIDVAVFYLDYSNRQANSIVLAPGSTSVFLSATTNGGKASGPGVEGSINFRLGHGLQLDATGSYSDVTADVTNAEVVKGERAAFVPDFTGSVSLSQRVPLPNDVTGMWRIDYQHADPYQSISRGLGRPAAPGATPPVVVLENFSSANQDYLNLRVGLERSRWGLYFDATNILNEDSYLFPNSPVAVSREGTHARPRSYGLTLRWNYDK